MTALVLRVVFALLAAALVPLSLLARQSPMVNGGEALSTIPFAAVGFVIARRQPRNPIGWLLLGIALCLLLSVDSGPSQRGRATIAASGWISNNPRWWPTATTHAAWSLMSAESVTSAINNL